MPEPKEFPWGELWALRSEAIIIRERIETLEKLIKTECCIRCLACVNRKDIGPHCEGCDIYAVLEVEP